MIKKNKIIYTTIIIILLCFIINYEILYSFSLNESLTELEEIIQIVQKYFNPENIPILNKEEKIIAEYWKNTPLCPFSKLTSHGLTKEEAFLIMEFFNINSIEDLKKIEEFIKSKK